MTLAWQTTDANSVSINQGIGSVAVDGSHDIAQVTDSTTYRLTATNETRSATCNATVTVGTPADCTLDGVTVLHGNSRNFYTDRTLPFGSSCTDAAHELNRTCVDGTLSGDPSYQYRSCVVDPPESMDPISISADPALIRFGESSIITWDGANAASCTVTGPNFSESTITGSEEVLNITGESTFTLECSLDGVVNQETTTVKVLPRIQES